MDSTIPASECMNTTQGKSLSLYLPPASAGQMEIYRTRSINYLRKNALYSVIISKHTEVYIFIYWHEEEGTINKVAILPGHNINHKSLQDHDEILLSLYYV